MNHVTHCALRLGDNLQHLHFLRKLAHKYPRDHFTHYAHRAYLPNLIEVIADVDNIRLGDLDEACKPGRHYWDAEPVTPSFNAWKNAFGFWEIAENGNDYVAFYVDFFDHLAHKMGLENPIQRAADFLFDYPALAPKRTTEYDFLFVNSEPQSGQALGFQKSHLDRIAHDLHAAGHAVITTEQTHNPQIPFTREFGATVTHVGVISNQCKNIIAVSTGPSWPTFNVWNEKTVDFRALIIDNERVDIIPNTVHVKNAAQLRTALQAKGFL